MGYLSSMRDIKFRVWDGEIMWSPEFFIFNQSWTYHTNWSAFEDDPKFGKASRIDGKALMQYTGLKDKNGKEIYEGDIIVAHDVSDGGLYIQQYPGLFNGSRFEVGWGDSCWEGKDHDDGYIHMSTRATYEIIGNIYENPELVDKSE